MLLKYNIKNINKEKHLINIISKEIVENNDNFYRIKITTSGNHNLKIGDNIVINKIIPIASNYEEILDKLKYNKVVFLAQNDIFQNDNKHQEEYVKYTKGHYWIKDGVLTKINNFEIDNILEIYNSDNDIFQIINEDFTTNTFSFIYPKYRIIHITDVFDGDNIWGARFEGNICKLYNKGDIFYIKRNTKEIKCIYINANFFNYSPNDEIISINDVFKIKDNRFINELDIIDDDILFYEFKKNISLIIPSNTNIGYGLNTEDIIKHYFEEKKQELLPNIVDYEKRCFTPFFKDKKKLIYIENIIFNIFLRDRTGCDNWNTNDNMGWNQYRIENDNNKIKFILNEKITNGDLLGLIGFTDEDVYYQKKKLSKSFLRLSFYDTNNPLNQMLLFYSTIFLDTNELYTKYIKNIDKKISNPTISLVSTNLDENNLSLSFKVGDKYNRNSSSEGYYLYLFPDNLEGENERVIYMKAEFNHGGYGKTIPLIYPNYGGNICNFGDVNFPKSLINEEDNNLSELYKQMFIPITIKYDNDIKDYVYFFNLTEKKGEDIVLNLYEPKLNPLN